MKTKSWLRLYHEFADDPKIQMLAFEDQRHYVMVLCLKGRGVIDSGTPSTEYRERMIAKALGLDPLTSREVKFRLMEPGLIDEQWQPVKWNERQFESDTSTERVQKYREKRKRFGNVSSKQEPEPEGQLVERTGNVSVTAQIRSDQSRENSPSGNSLGAKSATPRAIPSGSQGAPEPDKKRKSAEAVEQNVYDAAVSRARWRSWTAGTVFGMAHLYDVGKFGCSTWDDIPSQARASLIDRCKALSDFAVNAEQEIPPVNRRVIETTITDAIVAELKRFQPATLAERAAAAA